MTTYERVFQHLKNANMFGHIVKNQKNIESLTIANDYFSSRLNSKISNRKLNKFSSKAMLIKAAS